MQIQGLQKLTLLDYPGRTACTVFLSGCNFRCPFCHNAPLLTAADEDGMDEDELLAFLKKRRGLLDGYDRFDRQGVIHFVERMYLQAITPFLTEVPPQLRHGPA